MVELLRYLEANGFTTFIASGGDRDFMRAVADAMYGIPPERVDRQRASRSSYRAEDGDDVVYTADAGLLRRRARRSRSGSGAAIGPAAG